MVAIKRKERSAAKPSIQLVPVAKLLPTPDNRRRHISNASVESLARSMKHDGVIQPIVVRPHPEKKGFWEIRAGERRWRAAKVAGLAELPAIVRSLDDPSALSVTIAENMQRQDPHPLEEAATIQQAFDRDYDIKAIAAKLGKSVQYVARRASLTRLTKAWKDEILKPDSDASQLSVAHLELIARLPAETQDLLSDNDFSAVFGRGFPTVEELRRIIDGNTHTLRTMSWPLDDETLDPRAGACVACPKRSSCRPMLFDDQESSGNGKVSKTDRCLDPQCFDRKQTAWVQRCEAEIRREHPNLQLVQVGYSRLSEAADESFGERITHVYAPTYVRASDKQATPCMQIDGPKAGQLVHLNLGGPEQLNGHSSRKRPRDPEGKIVPMTLEERQGRLQKRRNAMIVKSVTERLQRFNLDDAQKAVERIPPFDDKDPRVLNVISLLLAFGTPSRADRPYDGGEPWKEYERFRKQTVELRMAHALHGVVEIWQHRLRSTDNHVVNTQALDARRLCELLGWDFVEIEAAAITAIPEPKSWANLRPADAEVITQNGGPPAKAVRKTRRQRQGHRSNGASRLRRKRRAA